MVGTRGIPAHYGGFETCVQELSVRMAARGHDVTVYCRREADIEMCESYKGVKLVYVPSFESRYASFAMYGILSAALATLSDSEVVHIFGCGRVPLALIARLTCKKAVITLDGLEWKRRSYPWFVRAAFRSYAELAMVLPNITVVDSDTVGNWYKSRTGTSPMFIPYGTACTSSRSGEILSKYGLKEGEYLLFIGRLVPEKEVHTLVGAFGQVRTDKELVIVGDNPHQSEYVQSLKNLADTRVRFLGYVYGEDLDVIRNGSVIYVHPSALEGTSISLLEAMGSGLCIVASDLAENVDVVGECGVYFKLGDRDTLRDRLQELLDNPSRITDLRGKSKSKSTQLKDWDAVTDMYLEAYRIALGKKPGLESSCIKQQM